jgi:asparagine synthase (glutamine-hydrolysing)
VCGLLAIFRPGGVDDGEPKRLLGMLAHRGPDASAVWLSADRRVAFGHCRLKIIDLSDGANQPMVSPDGRWCLIYNGEIVNYRDVRAAYRGPWQFRTAGDTEVLLATFAEDGFAAMDQWVGMFAFVLYDRDRQRLFLARDRFGIKPLYWVRLSDGGVAFASEIPPLLTLLPRAAADEDTIRTYLETGLYDTGSRTFFAGIQAIEPGSVAELDLRSGALIERRWYQLGKKLADLSDASEQELIARGTELIERAVRDHLIADVRVGLNVSGGVDSSVLVRVSAPEIDDLHVFTQDFEEPYSEGPWVRKVADGTHLHLCTLKRGDIEDKLDWTVRRQAEPFGGVSVIAYDSIYRAADAEGVTVLLDGNGVDECFLGYTKYANESIKPGQSIDGSVGVAPKAIAARLKREAAITPVPDYMTDFADPMKATAAMDLLRTKIPRGLRFNDRMSMGHSRELRVPFLDHRLVEFGFSTPSRYLMAGGKTKALFRDIAKRWLPADVADAKKRSVQSPQREWLANEWRPLVLDILRSDSFGSRGWVDPVRAEEIYRNYVAGSRENSFFVWQWLNLELWARAFLD